ncbi:probable N-acetyltransferase CML1 [Monodelphis domestica]|uniref:probable N-acetyltransferase CML1 n=1 Tax=Monodelphis domestica TaxID=13616 RepID=UPI0000F2BB37|nr:probable N-acetyltransferase CML1 [Monodelphis domestica]XP_016283799.1 probable N-acetyltransferase CML1 [Monodelphis domestica]XP_016283800.1 probable N-acetyltransferase CML1 [Monodelphis domestica]
MAPYHIRKYQDQDRETVIDIFTKGILYHVPASFFHLLKQPRSFLLLFGVSGAMFLGSGSCILSLLAFLGLLIILWWIVRYPYSDYVDHALHTDMRDIRKSYLSDKGSCFWVAELEGRVVGIVCARPVEEALGQKQLELLHLSVGQEHRGQGIAKSLTQTVLQFAQDQKYDNVVLNALNFNYAAQRVYESVGFWKTHEAYDSLKWKMIAIPFFFYEYTVPSSL